MKIPKKVLRVEAGEHVILLEELSYRQLNELSKKHKDTQSMAYQAELIASCAKMQDGSPLVEDMARAEEEIGDLPASIFLALANGITSLLGLTQGEGEEGK